MKRLMLFIGLVIAASAIKEARGNDVDGWLAESVSHQAAPLLAAGLATADEMLPSNELRRGIPVQWGAI